VIRWLVSDFFAASPMLAFPVIALLVFFAVFIAVSLRAIRMANADVDRFAAMPLDGEQDERNGARHG
jgi:hypothetical protein